MRARVVLVGELLLLCVSLQGQTSTTTALASVTPAAPQFGQAVALTATVAPASAIGSVAFMDGGVLVGVGNVIGGVAHLTTITLPAGRHAIRAVYGGGAGGTYIRSESAALTYIVTAGPGGGFSTASPTGLGVHPISVAVGDFNGDGKADLATANPGTYIGSTSGVSILLGNGNGTFSAAASPAGLGTTPFSVAVGDFNADGKADLAVANYSSHEITILLGNGDGTFSPAASLVAGPNPSSIAVGDFNGDGKADLVVADQHGNNDVSIMLGLGNGTFMPRSFAPAGTNPSFVTIGDFNGDGRPDLAVANEGGNNVSILLNDGMGYWLSQTPITVGSMPESVAVGDFNGDGKADLAVANDGGTVSVLLGNGAGMFSLSASPPAGSFPFSVAVGDFNGDGKTDLAVTSDSSEVSVLLGNGNGTFLAAAPMGVQGTARTVAVGDFNADGKADLAVANLFGAGNVSVFLGTALPSTTTSLMSSPNPSQYGHTATLTADVTPSNASGRMEFLDGATVVGAGPLNLSGRAEITTKLLASGSRALRARYEGVSGFWASSLSPVVSHVVSTASLAGSGFGSVSNYSVGTGPNSMVSADFNGDGKVDLATANYGGGNVSVRLGNGSGGFLAAVNYSVGTNPQTVAAGDFNADGKMDLAVANFGSNDVSVLLGIGDGTFQTAVSHPGGGTGPTSVAVGDFNGDGQADLAVANYYNNNASILLGDGAGGFQAPLGARTGAGPISVAVADFNGDGKADLAVADFNDNNLSILLGDGNGGFQLSIDVAVGTSPAGVVAGDFNADGKPDLAVANYGAAFISVLLGNGNGTFQPQVNYPTGSAPYSVATGDLNADGKIDLVVANVNTNNVSILLGNGDGTFQASLNRSAGTGPSSVLVEDFNGDGRSDLAVANSGSNNISVLLGTPAATIGVAPNSGIGALQTFVSTYATSNGYQGLRWVQMLFAVATNGGGQSFCLVHYDVQGNSFWLYGDGGFFVGPITPGTPSNVLQNSLCALNTSGSSKSGNGTTLTVNAALVFKTAGARNIYLRAMNLEGNDTDWVQQGTWTTAAAALGTMTVSPSSGSVSNGTQQTFTLTFPDPPGFLGAAFGWEQFLVAAAADGGGQPYCYVHYDRGGNGLWMYSSDVGFFLGPVTPGTASSALNSSACSINTAGTTVTNNSGNLVVTVPVTLKSPMIRANKLFERTLDVLNRDTDFVQTGTFTVN